MPSGSPNGLYLALDQGGHASRALVFTAQGERVAASSHAITTRVDGVRVELDAEEVVASLQAAIEAVCAELGAERSRLVAAGLATQRSNIACWHRGSGLALMPVLSWQDRRAADYLKGADLSWFHDKTGLFPNAHYGASKMAWCLDHVKAVQKAAQQGELMLGPMASYLASRLTNSVPLADPANASRTLLWNLRAADWDDEICEHFHINPDWLPQAAASRGDFGILRVAGLELPLTVVTGDLAAAAFADGRPRPDIGYITVGTGGFIQRIGDQVLDGDRRLLNGVVWHEEGNRVYSLEGTVNGVGSALQWFAERNRLDEELIHRHIERWCATAQNPPLFLNGVSGLGSPYWCADFEPRFVGEGSLEDQLVAVVESMVFLLISNLLAMSAVLPAPTRLQVSGGLAVVNGFCQRLADLSGLTVVRSGESEGTAKGLAFLLAGMPADWHIEQGKAFEPQVNVGLVTRFHQWSAALELALRQG